MPKTTKFGQVASALAGALVVLAACNTGTVNQPDLKERVVTLGFEPSALNPDELTSFMKAEIAKWGQAVKLANIRLE